jgi:hypothetical protein
MTAPGPATDADVPAFWRALGLPGLLDTHVHFMPDNVLAKVWAYFDAAGPMVGRRWPIEYRWEEDARLARLRALGVRRFPSLLYPHKPGMAEWLNEWAAQFAVRVPECWPTATFFPEPSAGRYVVGAIEAGARVFKAHVQVGGYDPRDELLAPVWGALADAGVPVVVHVGNGPVPGAHTGAKVFAEVLAEHPQLTAIVAHLGMPEYAEFLDLARRHERVYVDTTMVFVDFTEASMPFPPELRPALVELAGKVLLGSDFPNIPHSYAHQLAALARLDLGDDWLRAVCWHNAARLYGVGENDG